MLESRDPRRSTPNTSAWAGEAFRLLCDTGAALSEAPDPRSALTALASRVAGSVADLCTVDVTTPDGVPVRVAVEHRDPALATAARELRVFPAERDAADAFGRVHRTGKALLVPEVDGAWLEASVDDAGHRQILHSIGLRSLIVAPLVARGRSRGQLALVSTDPSRRYDADHLALAEELGRRAALTLEYPQAQAPAPEAHKLETLFIAAMSHELRTPLHVATMFAELLLMGVPEPIPPAARGHVEHIRAATRHLDELVEQVLAFSRLEAEREVVRGESVDLARLARETASLIEPLARQKGLGFGTDLPEGRVTADTDPNKVRQILFNLLGNAVKFTGSGEVRLGLRLEGDRAVFEVRDTGIGIDLEHRERIFEPFWQVDRESVAGSKGTGLGLGIVRRLVRLLGGEVEVESARGAGSVFRLLLPLEREDS